MKAAFSMNLIFCLVSLLGAFLLFQVQPVISKFILPWFGGSPGVWTTCMLFFQVVLFGGYSYAHLLAGWKPKKQAMVHGTALIIAALCLPIEPSSALKPTGGEEPVARILWLLLRTVGLPYLVLSATSPLVQVWFSHQYPKRSPWRLYSLSNIGSLTALLSYPVLIETRWDVVTQTKVWSGVFVAFAVLMIVCGIANVKKGNDITPEGDPHPLAETHEGRPTWLRRLLWVALPGFASMALLATTNHVCQDVAVIPFLWVAPLSLYLVSFIICFDHPRWYRPLAWALPALVLLFVASGLYELPWDWSPGFVGELVLYLLSMFVICMVCHGELASLKPGTKFLTEYYLLMSAGGALGGLLVSVIAPIVFKSFFEWSVMLLAGFALMAWVVIRSSKLSGRPAWVAGGVALLVLAPMIRWELADRSYLARERDFYGVLGVRDFTHDETHELFRTFMCGGTEHGRQSLVPEHKREPLTYYGRESAIGITLDDFRSKPDARVGVIGMGAGTVACYAEKGQTYRFYEINPTAVKMALQYFSFVPDLQARGATYECAVGDARLMLEKEETQHFDVLLLDAFSGDSVPVHLLTSEAFALYRRHLKPDGIIVAHITNHYLNLAPVLERVAKEHGLTSIRMAAEDTPMSHYDTDYIVLTNNAEFIARHPPAVPSFAHPVDVPLWTDHRHNLFQILHSR